MCASSEMSELMAEDGLRVLALAYNRLNFTSGTQRYDGFADVRRYHVGG
jgi:hypothetical protein